MHMAESTRRELPPLLAVRAFEAAARRLSFSLAAQELHVTQSAVSRQIRLLEDFLGYPLFRRMTRSVELTSEGVHFFRASQQSLDILQAATRRGRSGSGRQTLKLSITPSLATLYLLPRLPAFAEAWPDIEVRVRTSTAPADFEREDVDAAIRLGPLPGKRYAHLQPHVPHELVRGWRGVSAFRLWDEVLTPVISRHLIAGEKALSNIEDLGRFTLLSVATRPTAWSDWFLSQGVALPSAGGTIEFGHFFMTLDAARAGRGVALVPTLFLQELDSDSDLVCPFESTVPSAGEYYFLCREEAAEREPIEPFLKWLQGDSHRLG